jgi:hypothetical protein
MFRSIFIIPFTASPHAHGARLGRRLLPSMPKVGSWDEKEVNTPANFAYRNVNPERISEKSDA